jgi:hypothetical protein
MSRRKSTAPPPPTPERRKEKSRFPFRRGDSSRSFREVDSPPPTSSQGLTPVPSQDPDPPRVPQPQYARGETNGVTSQDGASDAPRTNGNNFTGPPTARNIDQPLPQVSQRSLQDAKPLTFWPRYLTSSVPSLFLRLLLRLHLETLHPQWPQLLLSKKKPRRRIRRY